jgi:hypothetical protein
MPETPIDKDGQPELQKYKIRFAKNRLAASPPGDAVMAEDADQGQFGLLVSVPTDARHDVRSLGFGEDVRHDVSAHVLARSLNPLRGS